jgi:hypothetical protein
VVRRDGNEVASMIPDVLLLELIANGTPLAVTTRMTTLSARDAEEIRRRLADRTYDVRPHLGPSSERSTTRPARPRC